jgi:hypothetical protein
VRKLLILALALVAALGVVSSASAKGRDRNHDRLPDRWERAHHLSLKVKQAKRDQDGDGLDNRGEFRAHLDPRDRDTDNDGIDDGDENAGTVKSFDNGVLTITLAQGGDLSATVDGDTEIECKSQAHDSSHGDDGPNHDAGDDQGDDGPNHEAGDDQGDDGPNHDAGDDDNEDNQGENENCGTDALTAGAKVREAELKATSSGKRWEKVELSA